MSIHSFIQIDNSPESIRGSDWWRKLSIILGIFLLFALSACDDDNNKEKAEAEVVQEEPEPVPPETVAPTAGFSVAATEGKSPLIVEFTNESDAGSSPITAWAWDFGDGGTSDSQSPTHTYEEAGTYDVVLSVTSDDGQDSFTLEDAISVLPADVVVTLSIFDTDGEPISDVSVSSATIEFDEVDSNQYGQTVLTNRPSDMEGMIKLSKEGYEDGFVYLNSLRMNQNRTVSLMRRTAPFIFESLEGGTFIGRDGVSVTIHPESLVDEQGNTVNGAVSLYITPIDVMDSVELLAFPGRFEGIPAGRTDAETLFSYGVASISFYLDGEELQLKDGEMAELLLPVYATKNLDGEDLVAGDIIPMWILDEETGLWIQEFDGVVQESPLSPSGYLLAARTSHFSAFNTDAWGNPIRRAGPCSVSIQVVGAELDFLQLSLRMLGTGLPRTAISKTLLNTANGFTATTPKTAEVLIAASQGTKSGSTKVNCGGQSSLSVEVNIEEDELAFFEWSVRAKAVFGKNASDEYEISHNDLLIGNSFIGTNEPAIVSSTSFSEDVVVANGSFNKVRIDETDPRFSVVFSKIEKGDVFVEQVDEVEYVDTKTPEVGYAQVWPKDSALRFAWNAEGADSLDVYYLENDPSLQNPGVLFASITDMETRSHQQPNEFTLTGGFVRFVFYNQYGRTEIVTKFSEAYCPPFSELCALPTSRPK